jgi:flagellar hook-associated protein 3 FlgL
MNNFMSNINRNMSLMELYQNQLSSGRRITRLSDDPIGIMSVLDARAKLRKLGMHSDSIGEAKSWLRQTESSLSEMNNVIVKLYETAESAANGTMTDEDRQAAGELVKQLREHIVQLGNSPYGGRYIFGGYNTTSEPFTYDAGTGELLYNGENLVTADAATVDALKAQVIKYATGVDVTTIVSLNGVQLMGSGDGNIDKILGDFYTALTSGADAGAFQTFVGQLQDKQQDILALLADVGGRTNRLDMMASANEDSELNYTEVLSNVEDVDQVEATMQYKMAEAVYRSALAVGARVIMPTLLDFLS